MTEKRARRSGLASRLRRLALHVAGDGSSRRRATYFSQLAWSAINNKNWSDGEFFAEAAVRADPDYAYGYRVLGYARLRGGSLDAARRSYEEGLRRVPNDVDLARALADLEMEIGDYAAAQTWLEKAVQFAPESPELLSRLGNAALYAGDVDTALRALEAANQRQPSDATILASLGSALRRKGDFHGAVRVLREAVAQDPGLARAQYDLGLSLAALEQWREALVYASAALRLEPENQGFAKLVAVIRGNLTSSEF